MTFLIRICYNYIVNQRVAAFGRKSSCLNQAAFIFSWRVIMYNVNDIVIYASYGVCVVTAIEIHDFSGENVKYYVLQPIGDNKNKFYIPTSNSLLTEKLRIVCSRDEVNELIRVMPDEDFIWIEDEIQRKETYRKIIDEGDRRKLIKLIKTLYTRKKDLAEQNKKLYSADERFLNDAENLLYGEFAYALNISRDEVVTYICDRLDS